MFKHKINYLQFRIEYVLLNKMIEAFVYNHLVVINVYKPFMEPHKPFPTIFLKARPEARVSVTQKQYTTICNPKMYPYTKFWIPTSHNIQILSGLYLSRNEARGQGQRDLKTVCGTPWPIDVSTFQTYVL